MIYKVLADITVFIHFLWVLFIIFGAFAGIRSRIVMVIHISGIIMALVLQFRGWYCPLTYLEVWLRAQHSTELTYTGSFIIHYMEKIVYIQVSQNIIIALTIIIGVFNVWIYFQAVRLARRRRT
jgi:ABC-type multidrug transport system permease subunit